MNKEKLVLAYSGGLDTSVLVHWLDQQGYEVIALCLDLGQKVEDIDAILEKGKKAGAAKVLVENVEEEAAESTGYDMQDMMRWSDYLIAEQCHPLLFTVEEFIENYEEVPE